MPAVTSVRLSGILPPGAFNGLTEVADEFVGDTAGRQIVVALIEVKHVVQDVEKARQVVVLKIARVEAISREDDQRAMKRIMMRANEERSGQTVLPFDTEDEIDSFFGEWAAEQAPKKGKAAEPAPETWQDRPADDPAPGLRAVEDPPEE